MHINYRKIVNAVVLILYFSTLILFYSCSSGSIMDNPELYKGQVEGWLKRVNENPKDEEALKHLSAFYTQTHQNIKARKFIDMALKLSPDDPELTFYKGLNLEYSDKPGEAIDFYKGYTDVDESSPYRQLMEGRYLWLKRQQAFSDVDSLIKNEKALSNKNTSDSTMAVFPLIYEGIDKKYFPLSRGFSEMISIDLAKVKSLTILERIRIQAVLDELKFGQSSMVDKSTAPRAGKLLGAGTIVSGDYDVSKDGKFTIDLGSWDVRTSQRKLWVNKNGNLDDFFTLQKEIVFAFLQKNNIELTQAEKEAIAYIPTQNLQAFVAFSRGLMQEDGGHFGRANSYFQRATELDPNFKAAISREKSSQAVNKCTGSTVQFVSTVKKDYPAVTGNEINLVHDRMVTTDQNVLSNFNQTDFNRTPSQDKKGLNITLPDPPPPPVK